MRKRRIILRTMLEYIVPIFAGFIYCVSVKYFIRPSSVIMTGTEGISIATSYYFDSEVTFVLMYSIFQFILIIFSFIKIGSKFSIKTLLTVSTFSILFLILPNISFGSPEPENERLVLVFFGAIIAGIAKALSLKNRGSVGDEDIIAVFISEKLRKPVGKTIIISGAISMIYGLILLYLKTQSVSLVANTLIYTTIFIFVSAETVNNIFKRFKYSRVIINAEDSNLIGEAIQKVLPNRSFSISNIIGGFTNSGRKEISLVLTQEELPELLNTIRDLEGKFFLYHYEIDGVVGRFPFRKF
jgi:uncharacterized membrane-anchored protein YitT (DUF2179 family)